MKRWARVSLKVLGGLLLGVVTLAAAWAAFNNRYTDDAPRPVPDALRVPPSSVPAERNAMFALIGLSLPGDDAHAQGLKRWAAIEAGQLEQPADAQRWPSPDEGPAGADGQPVGKAWHCDTQTQACAASWTREAAGLRVLTDAHAEIGHRCEALARPGMAIEEPLPTRHADLRTVGDGYTSRAMALPMAPAVSCLRWLQLRAVLAAASGDRAAMLARLTQASALTGAMLDGTRTLIGVQVAGAMARSHWRVLTDLAALVPASAPALRAMLPPLSPRALDASAWIRTEAQFGRESIREMACIDGAVADPAVIAFKPPATPMRCGTALWSMPNATSHLMDEQWLRALQLAPGGPLEMLDWYPDSTTEDFWDALAWRNSVGRLLVGISAPNYQVYARKQASLLLLNEAARLALAAGEIAPARRAEWLAAQPMDARLRERLSLDGDRIAARLWEPVSRQSTLHYPIPPGVTSAGTSPGSRTGPVPTRS